MILFHSGLRGRKFIKALMICAQINNDSISFCNKTTYVYFKTAVLCVCVYKSKSHYDQIVVVVVQLYKTVYRDPKDKRPQQTDAKTKTRNPV